MRVLLITYYFPPEIGSAAHLFYELGVEMIQNGVEVEVVTGFPRYNLDVEELEQKYRVGSYLMEEMAGMIVHRVAGFSLPRNILSLRGLDHFLSAWRFYRVSKGLKSHFDVVLVYSPPLPLGLASGMLRRTRGWKSVMNVQDLFPQNAIDLNLLKNGLVAGFLRWIERVAYSMNDAITVHSEQNGNHVREICPKKEIHVLPNFVNTNEIHPGSAENDFSRDYGLSGKYVVSFAGVLGKSQGLDVILDAALLLQDLEDLCIILVGSGMEEQRIKNRIQSEEIVNVRMIPMQPKERYPLVLHSSNVGLMTLDKTVKTPVVPSKLLSIMASGIPVAASMPLDGDAPKIVSSADCGVVVDAGDCKGLASAIRGFYTDSCSAKLQGQNGREYVVREFGLEAGARKYIEIFK